MREGRREAGLCKREGKQDRRYTDASSERRASQEGEIGAEQVHLQLPTSRGAHASLDLRYWIREPPLCARFFGSHCLSWMLLKALEFLLWTSATEHPAGSELPWT